MPYETYPIKVYNFNLKTFTKWHMLADVRCTIILDFYSAILILFSMARSGANYYEILF
jgi:hypothetical protein